MILIIEINSIMSRHTFNSFLFYMFYLLISILFGIYIVNLFLNKDVNVNIGIDRYFIKDNYELLDQNNFIINQTNSTCDIEVRDLNNGYFIGKFSKTFIVNTATNFTKLFINYNKIYQNLTTIIPEIFKKNYRQDINDMLINISKTLDTSNKMLINLIAKIYCF